MSGFVYYILSMYLWVNDMATWGVCYISSVMFYYWNFYACQLRIIWRCDVYFLNIYYIHVIYRFNISRVLHEPRNEDEWEVKETFLALVVFSCKMKKNQHSESPHHTEWAKKDVDAILRAREGINDLTHERETYKTTQFIGFENERVRERRG